MEWIKLPSGKFFNMEKACAVNRVDGEAVQLVLGMDELSYMIYDMHDISALIYWLEENSYVCPFTKE